MRRKKKPSGSDGDKVDGKFSVFEFNDEVDGVECEFFERFRNAGKKPHRKAADRDDHPIDKYCFIEYFSKGKMAGQKDSGDDVMDVDAPERVSVDKDDVCTLDSDEAVIMDWRSSPSDIVALDDEGSLNAETSGYGDPQKDCEPAVMVSSKYAKYGNIRYSSCCLFFTPACVRLEGSILTDKTRRYVVDWPTSNILKIEYQHEESGEDGFVCMRLKSEDKNGNDIKNQSSGFMELEFLVDDGEWFSKQDKIKLLHLKYKTARRTMASEWRFNESCGVIVFPEEDPDSISITSKDMECLKPGSFINDTIIDFYIRYLASKINSVEQHKFHFFNTFFFKKLLEVKERKDSFQSIHKWTRSVDIFEKDYVFIPVNKSLHWSLIVICDPGRIPSYEGSDMDASSIPCILHLNSLSGLHNDIEDNIKSYLWEEWKRLNGFNEDTYMKFCNLDFKALQLPQQENLFDCGLFVLHYAELFLDHAPNFNRTTYNDVLNENWFHPAEVTLKKRYQIRKLIQKIGEDSLARHPPDPPIIDDCGKSGASSVQYVEKGEADDSCIAIKNISDDENEIEEQRSSHWRETIAESPSARHSLVPTHNDGFQMSTSRAAFAPSLVARGLDDSFIAIKNISDDDDNIQGQISSTQGQACIVKSLPGKHPNLKEESSVNPSYMRLLCAKDEKSVQDDCSSLDALHRYDSDVEVTPFPSPSRQRTQQLNDVEEKGSEDDGCFSVENISDDDCLIFSAEAGKI